MKAKQLVLMAENNLQTRLIKEQLSLPDTAIRTCLPNEIVLHSATLRVDLVIIDYEFMRQLEDRGLLPDFDLFGWSLMIHNVPKDSVIKDVLRWKLLKGILLRNAPLSHLNTCVEYICQGGLWLPRPYLETLIYRYRHSNQSMDCRQAYLTHRERQILELLSYGLSNQQVASQLFLTANTVKSHLYKLYKKLGVHRRSDAIQAVRVEHRINDYR
jgi:LuxR family transcriptional regulator of csgAB operon